MSDAADVLAVAVRAGAGLFAHEERGLVVVEGGDRERWLDGMISNDVKSLVSGNERSGCYALLLTRQGRIVADLHVLLRPESFWLETAREVSGHVVEHLDKFVIADDVTLRDDSGTMSRFGLEGPRAAEILEQALGSAPALAPDACVDALLGGVPIVLAAYGFSGEAGYQIFAPAAEASGVADALRAAGEGRGLVEAEPAVLEILRIEAGIPRVGTELDEEVLPAEARLIERAVCFSKGCYTGQEVVARLESQGKPSHFLVGLRFADGYSPPPDADVFADGKRVGEVTSATRSARAGAIALGYVRSAHAAPGTRVRVEGHDALVSTLPFQDASPDGSAENSG